MAYRSSRRRRVETLASDILIIGHRFLKLRRRGEDRLARKLMRRLQRLDAKRARMLTAEDSYA